MNFKVTTKGQIMEIRICNNCEWFGDITETMMLGEIEYLCPECNETTYKSTDPCEWNPKTNTTAYEDEWHAEAEYIVGAKGNFRLCSTCAALPKFKRYKKRRIE